MILVAMIVGVVLSSLSFSFVSFSDLRFRYLEIPLCTNDHNSHKIQTMCCSSCHTILTFLRSHTTAFVAIFRIHICVISAVISYFVFSL